MDNLTEINVSSAVKRLVPISPVYMKIPIREGFNWDDAFTNVGSGIWYLVVFRSRQKDSINHELMAQYDERAATEASYSPGFLHYFAGTPCPEGDCLSFCIWQNREVAVAGVQREGHQIAASIAADAYDYYRLERHLIKKKDASASVVIEQL